MSNDRGSGYDPHPDFWPNFYRKNTSGGDGGGGCFVIILIFFVIYSVLSAAFSYIKEKVTSTTNYISEITSDSLNYISDALNDTFKLNTTSGDVILGFVYSAFVLGILIFLILVKKRLNKRPINSRLRLIDNCLYKVSIIGYKSLTADFTNSEVSPNGEKTPLTHSIINEDRSCVFSWSNDEIIGSNYCINTINIDIKSGEFGKIINYSGNEFKSKILQAKWITNKYLLITFESYQHLLTEHQFGKVLEKYSIEVTKDRPPRTYLGWKTYVFVIHNSNVIDGFTHRDFFNS